jgi:hypothetical protein
MSDLPQVRRKGLTVLLVVFVIAGFALWLSGRATKSKGNHGFDDYPELFVDAMTCPQRGDVLGNGHQAEVLARVRADRYPYDARDGVRAVQLYQQAEACYRAAGADDGVSRVRPAMALLTARVTTDYAAARLNLENALEQRQWSVALSEIDRLVLLTQHLGRHEYGEWLEKIVGRVAARASAAP